MNEHPRVRLDICVATHRRPEGLERLLQSLMDLRRPVGVDDVHVLVVNNAADDDGPRQICATMGEQSVWPIRCVIEEQPGIPAARNRALDEVAASGARWMAFVDDDEVVAPTWLTGLFEVQRASDADVVTGPVESVFEQPPPEWVERGGFFTRRGHRTGERVDRAFTGNVLMCVEAAKRFRFDERFARIGGSDAHYFRRMSASGVKIVWAEAAAVQEYVPERRVTMDWLVRRMYRVGAVSTLVSRDLHGGALTAAATPLRALYWIGRGLLIGGRGVVTGKHDRVRGRRYLAYARGLIGGLIGRHPSEYV